MGLEERYFQSQIENTSPLNLVVLLYDGCLRFLRLARGYMEENNIEQTSVYMGKARNIISELMVSLDMDLGGDLAKKLMTLYCYIYEQMVYGAIYKEQKYVDICLELLEGLHSAWVEIANRGDLMNPEQDQAFQSAVSEQMEAMEYNYQNQHVTAGGIDFQS